MKKVLIESFYTDDNYKIDCKKFLENDLCVLAELKLLLIYSKSLEKRGNVRFVGERIDNELNDNSEDVSFYINNNNKNECTNKFKIKAKINDDGTLNFLETEDEELFKLINEDDYCVDTNYKCHVEFDIKGKKVDQDLWNHDMKTKLINVRNDYYNQLDKEKVLEKYKKGLMKIYYDSVITSFKFFNPKVYMKKTPKVSAMYSYYSIKEYFESIGDFKEKYVISPPNVFVDGYPIEYDFLILNKKQKKYINDYVYDKDDVACLVEIKTAGLFFDKKTLVTDEKELGDTDNIEKYLLNIKQGGKEITNDSLNKPLLYFAIFESFTKKADSLHMYEYCFLKIKELRNIFGVFAGTICDDKFLVPYDYDLLKVLNENDIL